MLDHALGSASLPPRPEQLPPVPVAVTDAARACQRVAAASYASARTVVFLGTARGACTSRAATAQSWHCRQRGEASCVPVTAAGICEPQLREVPGKGRSMFAQREYAKGEDIAVEQPLFVARTTTDRCIGCKRARDARLAFGGGPHSPGCLWASVEAQPALSKARAWHRHLCGQLHSQPPEQRPNYIRVCCLLGLILQATASSELRAWLMASLRPAKVRGAPSLGCHSHPSASALECLTR